jgi:hypothetical protein
MIPQERRIEGLSIYFIFLISIFFLMENNNYVRFLGEGQEVLDSQEFINLSLVYWGGGVVHGCSFSLLTPILILILILLSFDPPIHAFIHTPVHCSLLLWRLHSIHSLTHSYFLIHVLARERKTNC